MRPLHLLAFSGLCTILDARPAQAREPRPARLHTTVTDPAGAPISTAVLSFEREGDWHQVNAITGGHQIDRLYLADGQTILFHQDIALTLNVTASGYARTQVAGHVLERKRKNRLRVVLQPLDPSPRPRDLSAIADPELTTAFQAARQALASPQGHAEAYRAISGLLDRIRQLDTEPRKLALAEVHELRALLAYRAWDALSQAMAEAPTDKLDIELEASRQQSVEASHHWMLVVERLEIDDPRPQQLCMSAQRRPSDC